MTRGGERGRGTRLGGGLGSSPKEQGPMKKMNTLNYLLISNNIVGNYKWIREKNFREWKLYYFFVVYNILNINIDKNVDVLFL